ncbi:MAG: VTT domain-containing protein [Deltaproteobacteria bacterium]|nr:VTT domain-containing protein [Deltaproteobacteria bacterium]
MQELFDLITNLHTPEGIEALIRSGGLAVLIAIVFAETGLLVGFFLPGDSLLVTAGVLCSRSLSGGEPILNIWTVNLTLMAAAVIGDQVGFLLGRKTGPKIFDKPDNRFFKKKYALEAHAFYEKHGGKAIILARFVPIMRTFVPFIAGVADMSYRRFVMFNVFGGIGWVLSMTMLGYFLGRSPWGEKIHLIILVVIFISILPMVVGIAKRLLSGAPKTNSAL